MPSSTAHEADRPQTAEFLAEEVVLSLPDDEWAAVKLVGDAIFKEPHGKETQPDISDAKLAGKRGRHETVNPEDAFGISMDQDGAQRLRVFKGWVEEARKAKATGDLPPSKEAASEAEHEVQVEAAQLKMILDRRLNRNTVQWIRDLAES